EIYVKKFLEPNEFLVGPAAELPVVRLASYLQAELLFPDAIEEAPRNAWSANRQRIAVLASGGKDSLLSLGFLEELGLETHSVFVNESGHHWHTAINAYRHLSATRPETTARVWTSSDRVFSWMLRHLPFVRQDFARLRSDEYPIRLWTVAVFHFGALPVLRRRGIGRLVIGDEFDTTRRLSFKGIPHYDGLYDQSRFFDEALTRYYRRKGWPLAQFSILRQASELLIQKTLVERYPELQHHQVSCHASHVEGDRALPCGRCEKCRRIVGMLLAFGADPMACGYSAAQIEHCLAELGQRGVHQEAAGARHMVWLLQRRGLLGETVEAFGQARPAPEVTKLRFHREASPVEALPEDLRGPIFRLWMHHAEGAVERTGRLWTPCDPLEPSWLARPYTARPDLSPPPETEPGSGATPCPYLLGELSWPKARERFAETDTALLPVGAVEQHGYHLPLDIDAWDADYLCRRVAEACSDPKPLVLPLMPYGVSYHHDDFPGTLSISPETLSSLVYEVGMAAARHGIRKLIIVNGHGGNAPTLQYAAQKINRDGHIFTCVDTGETSDADIARLTVTPNDVHAGEVETSTALATRPHLVDMKQARRAIPDFSNQYLDFSSDHSVEWYAHTARLSGSGVMGDPTAASVEKGEEIWRIMVDHLVAFVETLKGLSLDQIHARRH
ncbi:MAG: creatininase family protein, partial [Acidobacteria bacterium]|nr:creatininase family protein [Acidobacteriota bacterium]